MIPHCAGSTGGDTSNLNRENNGRPSGLVAPSPSRGRRPAASRKSLGGAILQNGHQSNTPAKNRRVSLAPSAAAASSSSVPSSSSNVDPCDIKDKSYLQNAIRKLKFEDEVSLAFRCLGYPELLEWGPDESDLNEDEMFTLKGSSDRVEQQFLVTTRSAKSWKVHCWMSFRRIARGWRRI
mmetsp:Transcript_705/g.1286  ORF Transcript_705/g.1286 Transcript_705/m.1286 type:complete len:180 (-) Transcript_705:476-1015(-)